MRILRRQHQVLLHMRKRPPDLLKSLRFREVLALQPRHHFLGKHRVLSQVDQMVIPVPQIQPGISRSTVSG